MPGTAALISLSESRVQSVFKHSQSICAALLSIAVLFHNSYCGVKVLVLPNTTRVCVALEESCQICYRNLLTVRIRLSIRCRILMQVAMG